MKIWNSKAHKNKISSRYNMSEYVMLIASAKIPAGKRSYSSWPLIRLSVPPHHPSSTYNESFAKEQKLIKQFFLPPPHRFSTESLQYQNSNANKYSILTIIELGPPMLQSSTGSQNFMYPIDSEHKLRKMGIENWLGFNLGSSWLGTRSHHHYTRFNH